jgi:hypothetical protein
MNKKRPHRTIFILFTALLLANMHLLQGQSGALAVQDSAALEAQLDYIHENTRVYNDYRAIREDVFQKLRRNIRDTISANSREAVELSSKISEQDSQIETLNTDLARAITERDEAIKNRDSLSFLGIQMKKGLYNTIMWLIVLGFAALAAILFTLFKRAHMVTREVKDELKSTQDEFEEYRKSAREKYEKLVVSHHSEIMKLKNS